MEGIGKHLFSDSEFKMAVADVAAATDDDDDDADDHDGEIFVINSNNFSKENI